MNTFKGMCVPICTPFVEGGEAVDEGAFKAHIDWMIENGVHIILAGGGTGEFAYLRPAELRRITEITAKHIAGRAHVFAQTSAINTADVIANSKAARDLGADAVMVLPPYFEGPSLPGVRWHYEQIAKGDQHSHRRLQHPAALQHRHHAGDLRRAAEDRQHPLHQGQYRQPHPHPAARGDRRRRLQRRRSDRLPGHARGCGRRHLGRLPTRCPRRRSRSTISWPSASSSRRPICGSGCCPRSCSSGPTTTIPRSRRPPISPAARSANAASRSCRSSKDGDGRAQRRRSSRCLSRPSSLTSPSVQHLGACR